LIFMYMCLVIKEWSSDDVILWMESIPIDLTEYLSRIEAKPSLAMDGMKLFSLLKIQSQKGGKKDRLANKGWRMYATFM